jgi:hypothetical protein
MIVETLRCSVFPAMNRLPQALDTPPGRLYQFGDDFTSDAAAQRLYEW